MVKIDDDLFKNLLWDRVNDFPPAQDCYPDWVWDTLFDDLESMGWLKPEFNDPKYIVDNIAVNGEIKPISEVESDYNIGEMTAEEWADDKGYRILSDPDGGESYILINYGL